MDSLVHITPVLLFEMKNALTLLFINNQFDYIFDQRNFGCVWIRTAIPNSLPGQ